MTVTEKLAEELSEILEPLAREEVERVVMRWKEAKEAQGCEFTGEEGDLLISYYNEAKKSIAPIYRLLVTSRGVEVIFRAEGVSELRKRLESVEEGRVKELILEFGSRELHFRLELRDNIILGPSLAIRGTRRREVTLLSRRILGCLARHRNLNGLVDNSVSLLLFPFVLGFLLLNAIFRCLGGVSLPGAFLFGLFLNVPLFFLTVILIRKGFPLVEFKLTESELRRVNLAKPFFFLVSLGIPIFSLLSRAF